MEVENHVEAKWLNLAKQLEALHTMNFHQLVPTFAISKLCRVTFEPPDVVEAKDTARVDSEEVADVEYQVALKSYIKLNTQVVA